MNGRIVTVSLEGKALSGNEAAYALLVIGTLSQGQVDAGRLQAITPGTQLTQGLTANQVGTPQAIGGALAGASGTPTGAPATPQPAAMLTMGAAFLGIEPPTGGIYKAM